MSDTIADIARDMANASDWPDMLGPCLLLADAVERLQSAPVTDSDRIARRDRNATAAMQGIMGNADHPDACEDDDEGVEGVARHAYRIADAMEKARTE